MKYLQLKNCYTCDVSDQCIFSVLSEIEKQKLNDAKISKTCKKEHYIYHEGYGASDCIVIGNGLVKLTRQSRIENESIIDFKRSGEFIGVEALGKNSKYQTSAVALTETSICIINKSLLEYFFNHNPKACDFLIASFISTTTSVLNRVVHITQGTGRAKLARTLILANQFFADGKKKEIKIKREQLAMLAGLSRETVSRLLAVFKAKKIIDIKINVIRILNIQKLTHLSEEEK